MSDSKNKPNPIAAIPFSGETAKPLSPKVDLKINPSLAVPKSKEVSTKVEVKSTVEIKYEQKGGWDGVAKDMEKRLTYHNKQNPDDWNQVDLQWYLKNQYAEKYGYHMNIPLISGHDAIKKIKTQFMHRLGKMPSHSIIKDYFDYCVQYLADDIIRNDGMFTIHKLNKQKYILDYIERANIDKKKEAVSVVDVSNDVLALTIDNLTAAFRIGSQYMVSNFGIIVPINFLVVFKSKTLEEAVAYVQGAMTKLAAKGQQEMQSVITATNSYQPYPRWLRFTDVERVVKMTITISDDNPVFDVFKEQNSK
jgi:hypothetical protein